MGSADEVNIQASELNRTMKVGYSVYTLPLLCTLIWCSSAHEGVCSAFLLFLAVNPCFTTLDTCCAQVINRFLSKFTGMSTDDIEVETDRDNFLGPEAAIDKGVIDKVLAR